MFSNIKWDARRLSLLAVLGLLLLGAVVYSNIPHAPFIYDDMGNIVENPAIKDLSRALSDISKSRYIGQLSFALNYSVGGLNVFGYHVVNILIHAINSIFIYYFVTLLFRTPAMRTQLPSRDFTACFTAFVFVSHPLQTQAVTYVVQRYASLATLFYVLSLVLYVKSRLIDQSMEIAPPAQDGRKKIPVTKSLLLYPASLACAVLAIKSKEIAFTLPFAVIMCELYFFRSKGNNFRRFMYVLPFLLILFIPLKALGPGKPLADIMANVDALSRETVTISRTDYLITQFRVIITYIRLLLFPTGQNFDYDYPIYDSVFSDEILSSLVAISFLIAVAVVTYKRAKLVSFGIAWFLLALSVESSIIPIRDVINEHRVYLPSLGFFLACAAGMERMVPGRNMKIAFAVMLVSLLSIGTYMRNNTLRDPEILWGDVIGKAPNNSRAYNNLGVVYKKNGDLDEAMEQFENSLRADRDYTAVYYNLGDVQYRLGNYEKALAYLRTALSGKRSPRLHMDILNKLGRTYGAMGRTEEAEETFLKAVELFPASVVLLNNLGVHYMKTGRVDSAIEVFEKAIKIEERSYLYGNLASAYARKGDGEKSLLMYRRSLKQGI